MPLLHVCFDYEFRFFVFLRSSLFFWPQYWETSIWRIPLQRSSYLGLFTITSTIYFVPVRLVRVTCVAQNLVLGSLAWLQRSPGTLAACYSGASIKSPYFGSRYSDAHLRRLMRFSVKVENRGLDHFRPKADKSTWQWHSCHKHYHSMETFSSYDLIRKYNDMSNGRANRDTKRKIDQVTIESNWMTQ